MQINPQPSIRPVPVRRKNEDKLDVTNATPNFENQVQDSNSNSRRKQQSNTQQGKQNEAQSESQKETKQKPTKGSIDTTA